jgi:hypothetical protein
MKIQASFWLVLALLLLSILAACTDATPAAPAITVTTDPSPTETPSATATPQATATTAPTPTPTRPTPMLQAIQQRIDEQRVVIISDVIAPEAGWLVIYAGGDDSPEEVVGYVSVPVGSSQDVAVEIDPFAVTPLLTARLHTDSGEAGVFEFPDADPPLELDGTPVEASFPVTLDLVLPALAVADQAIGKEGLVQVTSVTVPEAGWIALHADKAGEPGEILGQTPLAPGAHGDVVITFDWHRATTPMHLLLYQDLGVAGRFEPETVDAPFTYQGNPISATFTTTLPLDVYVIDQPVALTGEVVVERITVDQPAWVAVYSDFSGYTDRLLGYAPVEPGVTVSLTIPVETTGITSVLHVQLHADRGTEGEFETPGRDEPIQEGERLTYFSFQTDSGSYVITADQPAGDQIDVPLVVADVPVWLVILEPEEDAPPDEPGMVLGTLWLPPGIHRDLVVPIAGGGAGTTILAALHLDAGEAEIFEYPDGPDVPLRHLGAYIRAPFFLTE